RAHERPEARGRVTGTPDEKRGAEEPLTGVIAPAREKFPLALFAQLLLSDLLFTMGEGAVVALIQLYFVLRFHLFPGTLGEIFTISGLLGGVFALSAPLFVNRWAQLRVITTVLYLR